MSDTKPLFDSLRNSADPNVVAAIEAAIRDGSDRKLCRINVLNFAAEHADGERARPFVGNVHQLYTSGLRE